MQNSEELKYILALTKTPNIGPVTAKNLLNLFQSAENIYKSNFKQLMQVDGLGEIRAKSILNFKDFKEIEDEIAYNNSHNINIVPVNSKQYPQLLKSCIDAPTVLFTKGVANFNSSKIISIVGTRKNTEYGNEVCKQFIKHFENAKDLIIVSGLASGIDTLAHKYALKYNISTVGIMAHGHKHIYPSQNRTLANEIPEHGALVTEYFSNVKPEKENFPTRNRIVAGMAHVTLIIETETKGGSMITANIADSYNRDVCTFPGKVSDPKSSGCNYLIKANKANLITNAEDLCNLMCWENKPIRPKSKTQRSLFIELSATEQIVYDLISQKSEIQIDELIINSGLSTSQLAGAILNLELQDIIITLPGKIYKLL